jgi:hypothetical protein
VLKQCLRCEEWKPLDGFTKHPTCKSGRSPTCKACRQLVTRNWQKANPDKTRAATARWRQANPERQTAATKAWRQANPDWKSRYVTGNWRRYLADLRCEKRGGSRKHLTIDQLLALLERQRHKCALSGLEMTCIRGQGRLATNASLDRIDATGAYTLDNIQLVCDGVNMARKGLSIPEFISLCRAVVEHNSLNQGPQSDPPLSQREVASSGARPEAPSQEAHRPT